jgi:DNA adenine methylase
MWPKPGFKVFKKSYFGGKEAEGVPQTLINLIPPHVCYVAACLGHDAIMRYKAPARYNIGIDPDPSVTSQWKKFIDNRFLSPNRHNSQKYSLQVIQGSCLDILPGLVLPKGTFIFFDPPYLPETRKDAEKNSYNHEMTVEQHEQMLVLASTTKANVAISCYDSPMYKAYLKNWHKVDYVTRQRTGPHTQTLYMNYPPPAVLHDYRYLGKNYRERERIKLKISRFQNKLSQLPVLERNAIISSLKLK